MAEPISETALSFGGLSRTLQCIDPLEQPDYWLSLLDDPEFAWGAEPMLAAQLERRVEVVYAIAAPNHHRPGWADRPVVLQHGRMRIGKDTVVFDKPPADRIHPRKFARDYEFHKHIFLREFPWASTPVMCSRASTAAVINLPDCTNIEEPLEAILNTAPEQRGFMTMSYRYDPGESRGGFLRRLLVTGTHVVDQGEELYGSDATGGWYFMVMVNAGNCHVAPCGPGGNNNVVHDYEDHDESECESASEFESNSDGDASGDSPNTVSDISDGIIDGECASRHAHTPNRGMRLNLGYMAQADRDNTVAQPDFVTPPLNGFPMTVGLRVATVDDNVDSDSNQTIFETAGLDARGLPARLTWDRAHPRQLTAGLTMQPYLTSDRMRRGVRLVAAQRGETYRALSCLFLRASWMRGFLEDPVQWIEVNRAHLTASHSALGRGDGDDEGDGQGRRWSLSRPLEHTSPT
ncbi:hypothetical protein Micbo1qcDRAFT_174477 [Microdochium bolleyi]|uniref:Uncharacterized protein n=1 Tax=Microdochium bolleyi TaxID=196109 RepID=A0A136J8E5_9PEZI|nr:hypothetical protein Micbo1qcDRAFT_174477 [Microdochium bolleyi]